MKEGTCVKVACTMTVYTIVIVHLLGLLGICVRHHHMSCSRHQQPFKCFPVPYNNSRDHSDTA